MTEQVVKMAKADPQERIMDIISWIMHIPASHIHPYTQLQDDLDLDTIDLLLLIAELESQFNVYLTPEEVESIETIQDLSFLFQRQVA